MLKRLILALLFALAAAPAWAQTAYYATLSETNVASDSLARTAAFARPTPVVANWTYPNTPAWHYSGSGQTSTVALGYTPAPGSLLVGLCFAQNQVGVSISDDSSGPADNWIVVVSNYIWSGIGGSIAVWATNVTSGTAPTHVTCTQGGGSTQPLDVAVDNYGGSGNPFVQDGSGVHNTAHSASPAISITPGSTAGDLLWSGMGGFASGTATVNSPFTIRVQDTGGHCVSTSDDGISAGVAASTQETATYSCGGTTSYWLLASVAFKPASTLNETNEASDAVARQVAFGRGPTESNTASDSISRLGVFGRSDSESNTASDSLARAGVFARGESETNTASDSVSRMGAFGRGDSETNTASDALASNQGVGRGISESHVASDILGRQAGFGRGGSESNTASDALVRLASYGRGDSESNVASDLMARSGVFGRGDSETNTVADSIARSQGLSRGDAETLSVSDSLARRAVLIRGDSENNTTADGLTRAASFGRGDNEALSVNDNLRRVLAASRVDTEALSTSDSLSRIFAALRGDMETLAISDAIIGLRTHSLTVLPRHEFAVPEQAKNGAVPGQAKTGAEAGRAKTGTAPVH